MAPLDLTDGDIRDARPGWHRVESRVFLFATDVDGRWWVLRLNDFPDHPMFTLFIDGEPIRDIDDTPSEWGLRPYESLPTLSRSSQSRALQLVKSLGPYGSEVGTPCDGDWCTCSILDESYVLEVVPPIGSEPSPTAET